MRFFLILCLCTIWGCSDSNPDKAFDHAHTLLLTGSAIDHRNPIPHLKHRLSREEDAFIRKMARQDLSQLRRGGRFRIETPQIDFDRSTMIRVALPDNYTPSKSWPLIIFMHGSWTNYERVMGKISRVSKQFDVISITVDSRRSKINGAGWNFFPERSSVISALRFAFKHYAIDESRVHLWGHSNGAGGNFATAMMYPDRWASLSSFSTVLTPQFSHLFDNIKHLPIYIWQGQNDENITSLADNGQKTAEALRDKGHQVTFVMDPKGTHIPKHKDYLECWRQTKHLTSSLNPKQVHYSFPRRQQRGELPSRHLSSIMLYAGVGRSHWLEATDWLPGEGNFSIKGRIEGQTIHLDSEHVEGITLHLNDSLIDLDRPITVTHNGDVIFGGRVTRNLETLIREILERGSIEEAASRCLRFDIGSEKALKAIRNFTHFDEPKKLESKNDLRIINRIRIKGQPLVAEEFRHFNLLPSLAMLSLTQCVIDSPGEALEHLEYAPALGNLILSGTALEETCFKSIGRLPKLSQLSLNGTGVSAQDLKHLVSLEELSMLSLDGNDMSGADFGFLRKLNKLQYLLLNQCTISDAEIDTLPKLPGLKILSLEQCPQVSQEAVDQFKKKNPKCRVDYSTSAKNKPHEEHNTNN